MNRVVFILVACQFLLSCGSKSSDSSTAADSLVYGDTLAVSDDPGFDYDQQMVNQMLSDFNSARRTYDSVTFTSEYEMGSSRVHYYFQNNELMYIHKEATGEGGFYERSLMMVGESGIEEGFKINSEEGGWFTYLDASGRVWMKTGLNTKQYHLPLIIDNGEPANLEYEQEMKDHFVKISENKNDFRLKNLVYEFYLTNKKVQGEYGMADNKELYIVSKSDFFDRSFLNVTIVDKSLIQFYLKKWTPLFDEGNDALVRHSICGSEDYTEIFERDGKYFWRDQGAMDAVEYTIVSFEEGEGDSMEARIKYNFGTSQRILVFSEAENLLSIDRKTYTNNPTNYTIVDDNSDCAGE